MNDTADQMSLLDAIGIEGPDEAEKSENGPKKTGAKQRPAATKAKATRPNDVADAAPGTPAKKPGTSTGKRTRADNAPTGQNAQDAAPSDSKHLPLDQHLCFALYSANHAMHGVYKDLLKETGLTYPQFLAMTVLWDTNNVPVGALTSKLQLDTNTLTPLLKRLEAMGLITRTRNKKDERQVLLKLTRKGHALKKKTEHFSGCIFSATGLDLDELADLQAKIMKLRDNLRDASSDQGTSS